MLSPIQQLYYAWDISHKKSVSDDSRFTGVLSEARVDLNPHQVEAALFAFKSPLSKGAILADEVGLGKTIEAGIILSELWAENKRNILIVVPASLRNQWNIELMEKFYLPSFILDSESFHEGKIQISKGEKCICINLWCREQIFRVDSVLKNPKAYIRISGIDVCLLLLRWNNIR